MERNPEGRHFLFFPSSLTINAGHTPVANSSSRKMLFSKSMLAGICDFSMQDYRVADLNFQCVHRTITERTSIVLFFYGYSLVVLVVVGK